MGQLAGKVAIITGAGSGFGTGMAEAYVREGAKVIVADINAEAGERVAKSLGANAKAIATDVANGVSVQAMVQACVDSFGVPDIVINNAGTTHRNQPMLQVDEQTFDRVFNVNVKSIYHMAHAVVPVMRARAAAQTCSGGTHAEFTERSERLLHRGSLLHNASPSECTPADPAQNHADAQGAHLARFAWP